MTGSSLRRPPWTPSPALIVLSVALGFLLGGVLGALVVGAGVVASPRSGGAKPAAGLALGLLVIAAVATVVEAPLSHPGPTEDVFAPPRIGLNYALDRPVASAAARLAAFALLVAIATSVPRAGSSAASDAPAGPRPGPRSRHFALGAAVPAVPYVAAMAVAIVARVVTTPPPLPSAWLGLVQNLEGGLGYVVQTEGGFRAAAAAPPLGPLVAAFAPVSARVAAVIASALAVAAVMRLTPDRGWRRGATTVGTVTAVLVSLIGHDLAEALALLLLAAGLVWSRPADVTPARASVAGLCLAGAVLARPEAVLAVLGAGLWIGVSLGRRAITPVLALLTAAVVALVPWQLWLQQRFER